MGVGEKLKEVRLQQGHSLEVVEEETKIRKYYLEAIENNNYKLLPAKVYSIGFVKRYAKFLGLNEHEISELFKLAAYGSEESEESLEIKTSPPITSISNISWKNVVVAIVFLLAVIWTGDYLITYFTKDYKSPSNPSSPIVEAPNVQNPDKIDNNVPIPVKPEGVELIITANQKCWLNIIVDGEPQYNAILAVGENLNFKGENQVYLKAGNAGGITIIYNGKEMPALGNYGEVKEATYTSY